MISRDPYEVLRRVQHTLAVHGKIDAGTELAALIDAAIADTHPKDGDVKQAPLVSGGGSEGNRP